VVVVVLSPPTCTNRTRPGEVIHHLLVAAHRPPLGGEVKLAARPDNPERHRHPRDLLHLAHPAPFILGEVDVPFELRRLDLDSQLVTEVLNEAVDEMMRACGCCGG
jgi:hypothetical protein